MNPGANKFTLTLLLAALTAALFGYLGITYLVTFLAPPPQRPVQPVFAGLLAIVACLGVLLGLWLESLRLRIARSPGDVQATVIISAALGECPAIHGLLLFFMYGQRQWFFFLVAFAYFVGLWARRPAFIRRMDELANR